MIDKFEVSSATAPYLFAAALGDDRKELLNFGKLWKHLNTGKQTLTELSKGIQGSFPDIKVESNLLPILEREGLVEKNSTGWVLSKKAKGKKHLVYSVNTKADERLRAQAAASAANDIANSKSDNGGSTFVSTWGASSKRYKQVIKNFHKELSEAIEEGADQDLGGYFEIAIVYDIKGENDE